MAGPVIISPTPDGAEYDDTVLTFSHIAGGGITARIDPDPLGPVNKIVSIMNGGRRICSVLAHIPTGAKVELHHYGSYSIEVFSPGACWRSLAYGDDDSQPVLKPPHWCVEVNGRTILEVPDHELWPDIPAPKTPWRRRTWRAINTRIRAVADALAMRLGYHRNGECEW
ncbi:hypothetical protein [Mycobacterium marinum]|uniref:hypothetical protein n=1 Tax=Mycobacterium marinum TaxID=1781 RepID=UPI000E3B9CAC|nr:hypothetical protein [Mycobacterium marinum]